MTHATLFANGEGVLPEPIVYGLVDPRFPSLIRYVGQTINPAARYADHCRDTSKQRVVHGAGRRDGWVRVLRGDGVFPSMVLLARAVHVADLDDLEREWIQALVAKGQADLNIRRRSAPKAKDRSVADDDYMAMLDDGRAAWLKRGPAE